MFAPSVPLGRRDFLRLGGLVAAGHAAGLSRAASAPRAGGAKSCILVYLLGGPPQHDTFDPKPDAPDKIRGPFSPIATSVPGLRVCEHLPRLAALARHYAVVRTVSHRNNNHTPMIYYTLTGRQVEKPQEDNDVSPPQRGDAPHVGAVLASVKGAPPSLPGYVALPELAVRSSLGREYRRVRQPLRGGGAGVLGPLLDPLCVNGEPGASDAIPAMTPPAWIDEARQDRRSALLSVVNRRGPSASMAALQGQAVSLSGSRGGKVFSLAGEPRRVQERYGAHRFGKALLLARRLAEAGVPVVAVHFNNMTECDGWDTHFKNFIDLKRELLPMIDQSVSALLEDLAQRGLSDDVVTCMMGEFGRTPHINGHAGRDHWGMCQSVLLAGGGIKGGQVFGASDRIGAYPAYDPVDPVDVHATLYKAMGIDPSAHLRDGLDRPWQITTGRPIPRLL